MSRTIWWALGATTALSAWLAAGSDDPASEVVAPVARPPRVAAAGTATPATPSTARAGAPAAPAALPSSSPAREPSWPEPLPVALAAWTAPPPPPPPPRVAEPASAPQRRAPAFPYRWIGRLEEDGAAQALLADSTRSFGARVGDTIDRQWRVERVGTGGVVVTWMTDGQTVQVGTP